MLGDIAVDDDGQQLCQHVQIFIILFIAVFVHLYIVFDDNLILIFNFFLFYMKIQANRIKE